jgi:hypothetical protein
MKNISQFILFCPSGLLDDMIFQLLSIQESDLGVIRPGVFTNMSNIGRLSLTNNKIDAIESFELTADNRVRQFHFIGNHVLDLPHGRAIRIRGITQLSPDVIYQLPALVYSPFIFRCFLYLIRP